MTPELKCLDHELHAISGEFISDRDAFLRLGVIVAQLRRDLLTENTTGRVDVGNGLRGPALDLLPESRAAARKRAPDTKLNIGSRYRCCERDGGTQCKAASDPVRMRAFHAGSLLSRRVAPAIHSNANRRKCHYIPCNFQPIAKRQPSGAPTSTREPQR